MIELLLFTQTNCPNCPAMKRVIQEAVHSVGDVIVINEIDMNSVDEDLDFELLTNQIYIKSTPTVVARMPDLTMELWYCSDPPSVDDVVNRIGDYT